METAQACFTWLISPKSTGLWAMLQFLAVAVSLFLIYKQIKINTLTNALNAIQELDKRWASTEAVAHRIATCTKYETDQLAINRSEAEVLGFFEDLGLNLRKKVYDSDIVWEKYSYYVDYYWHMYEPHIKEFRNAESDNTWYEQFEHLHSEMRKVAKKKEAKFGNRTRDQILRFIEGEKEEVA